MLAKVYPHSDTNSRENDDQRKEETVPAFSSGRAGVLHRNFGVLQPEKKLVTAYG